MIYGELYTYDPAMFSRFFANAGIGMYTVTILQTLNLALTKCMCVVMPLKFKDIFTRRKAIWSFVIFNIFSIGIYIPIFCEMGVQETFSPTMNGTCYVLWMSSDRERVKDEVYMVILVTIPFSVHFIVIVCIVVLIKKVLHKRQVRRSYQSTQSINQSGTLTNPQSVNLGGKVKSQVCTNPSGKVKNHLSINSAGENKSHLTTDPSEEVENQSNINS